MRRSIGVAGTILAGVAVVASVVRRPLKAHVAEGTLPGRFGSWLNSYLNRPSYRLMAAALDLEPEDVFLDVACGWGEFLVVFGSKARRVAGIDVSEEKVVLARQRLADRIASGTAEVVQGDAATLPWEEGAFSAVMCMDAFAFFPAPEQVLAEVLRVLRPGGRMLMQIGMKWPDGPPKQMLHPATRVAGDEAAVRRMVEDAGFGEISISYGLVGGESRLGNLASRLAVASDELRIVGAVKPR
ncbi:MAG TPA: class I SAM-dependent methyltransferase [Coriobacteriia bacterium]|nr:class I SAM-dependent methyltransferase [Coriobacteriia bacterium]